MTTKHLKLTRSDFFLTKDELADYGKEEVKSNLVFEGYKDEQEDAYNNEDTAMYEDETGRIIN